MANYYQILEISESATQDEIKKAYRQLAKKYHPDLNPSEDAQERFIEIEEAYTCLSKASSRRIYDGLLRDQRSGRTAYSSASRRREQQYERRRSQARAQARYHSKMYYTQYQRDEKARKSIPGKLFRGFMNLFTAIALFFLLFGAFAILDQMGIDPDHSLFGILVFLLCSAYIISVIVMSFVYEELVKRWILGKEKKERKS